MKTALSFILLGSLAGIIALAADRYDTQPDMRQPGSMDQSQENLPSEPARTPATAPTTSDEPLDALKQTTKDISGMSPKEVCSQIAETSGKLAAGKENPLLDQALIDQGMAKMLSRKSEQQAMIKQEFGNADCKSETISGTHAIVVSKNKDRERLVPFVKQGNNWKLDFHAYRTLYRMDSRMPAGESKELKDSKK